MRDIIAKNAGIYITHNCNFNCRYCSVKDIDIQELSIVQWKKAVDVIADLNIENLTILGGEPTCKEGLVDLVHYITQHTDINLNLVSNGAIDHQVLRALLQAGLENYSTSVDSLFSEGMDKCVVKKTNVAVKTLEYLKEFQLKKITVYFMMNSKNYTGLIPTIRYFSLQNIHTYILPYHYAQNNQFPWVTRAQTPEDGMVLHVEHEEIRQLIQAVIGMKEDGYLISNSSEYLQGILQYMNDFSWHCIGDIMELRIDADGSLMCCHDYMGTSSSAFNIFDLQDDTRKTDFINAREADAKLCTGCFWPSQYHAHQVANKVQN